MKNTIRMFVAAAALAIAVPAHAQRGGGNGGGMRQSPSERLAALQKQKLFKDITLTAAQSAKIDSVMLQGATEQQGAMAAAPSGGGNTAARRESMQKMKTKRNDALKAVLTDEQKKKFDRNVAAMRQGRRGGL